MPIKALEIINENILEVFPFTKINIYCYGDENETFAFNIIFFYHNEIQRVGTLIDLSVFRLKTKYYTTKEIADLLTEKIIYEIYEVIRRFG